MTQSKNCGCAHHWVIRVLVVLTWVAAVLFFWSSWAARAFFGFDALYWAWTVVILTLLAKTSGGCRCCCGDTHCETCAVDKTM
jgi:uncharacterized membrane protein